MLIKEIQSLAGILPGPIQIFRQCGSNFYCGVGPGMHEGNPVCVQSVPLGRPGNISVQIIMPERAANAGKVYPDLVGPPGVKTAAYQRKRCLP